MARDIRLHKFLAHAGVGSRRKCEELIAQGRVSVDGEVVTTMGFMVDPELQEIRFAGEPVRAEPKLHYLFHKPKGVLSTASDKETRPRVIDFFSGVRFRLYTAGRLDEDSEGAILVTNDGAFAERVTHPSHGVPKTYEVRCRGRMEREALQKIRQGVWLAEGKTSPARIQIRRLGREVTDLLVTMFEGRNREIRRLFARFGHPVLELRRTRIGNLTLARLSRGRYRRLTQEEVDGLLAPGAGVARTPPRKGRPRRGR
ncbi:MAG: rRNA pseudouridine synthase [Planctomycetes bacterium]|nr:rRNA pseudouridine synthase [Planctomycetota bacterium]